MRRILFACMLTIGLSGCWWTRPDQNDPKQAWQNILNQCASTDLVGVANLLYFGPSNVTGPGSILRKAAEGDYRIRWPIGQIAPPPTTVIVVPGAEVGCSGATTSSTDFSASLSFAGNAAPISASLQNDLKRASDVTVQPTTIAWDTVSEGPYELYVSQLPLGAGPHADLLTGRMLVLYRALRIHGYSAKLDFSASDAASLQAKYSGPQLAGALSGGLNATWNATGTLTVTSTADFYIAGQLVGYSGTGFSARGPALAATIQTVLKNSKVTRETSP